MLGVLTLASSASTSTVLSMIIDSASASTLASTVTMLTATALLSSMALSVSVALSGTDGAVLLTTARAVARAARAAMVPATSSPAASPRA